MNLTQKEAFDSSGMAGQAAASCPSLSTKISLPSKPRFAVALPCPLAPSSARRAQQKRFKIRAELGGGDAETKKGAKKKFITREEEPEQYWQTAGEREGENPMKTPIPYIIIFGMSTPFVILAIAFANGWIKAPVR
ncbi:uncharacterized protein LOC115754569 [Rhodamnia argentea]|uniref:Uncharacterized protein LOC115754569 n=1 Tax=Rhodamnia argentea TaxID=178133 RepID=A0A8B8QT51_9MYRT|nr:uncharacterized protein LOC115754569 [Rhodamnia argentea]